MAAKKEGKVVKVGNEKIFVPAEKTILPPSARTPAKQGRKPLKDPPSLGGTKKK